MNRFEELCYAANNRRDNIVISSFEYNTLDIINFRYAFAKVSKEIDFQCSDSIVKTEHGYINEDMGCRTLDYLRRAPSIRWYLPENYTDELREENIEICLNATLGKIELNCRSWLYYIDAIQDLLYLPSDAYVELSENWMLQIIDLARPGSLVCVRLKERLRSSEYRRRKLRPPPNMLVIPNLSSTYAIDFL